MFCYLRDLLEATVTDTMVEERNSFTNGFLIGDEKYHKGSGG